MNKNLREMVLDAMMTDDSFNHINQSNILNIFENSSSDSKKILDEVFINLCGYSLETLTSNLGVKSINRRSQLSEHSRELNL